MKYTVSNITLVLIVYALWVLSTFVSNVINNVLAYASKSCTVAYVLINLSISCVYIDFLIDNVFLIINGFPPDNANMFVFNHGYYIVIVSQNCMFLDIYEKIIYWTGTMKSWANCQPTTVL